MIRTKKIPPYETYTVKGWDTLSEIAERFTGNAGAYPTIANFNDIKNSSIIHPGQEIRIPDSLLTPSGKRKLQELKGKSVTKERYVVGSKKVDIDIPYIDDWGARAIKKNVPFILVYAYRLDEEGRPLGNNEIKVYTIDFSFSKNGVRWIESGKYSPVYTQIMGLLHKQISTLNDRLNKSRIRRQTNLTIPTYEPRKEYKGKLISSIRNTFLPPETP